MTPNSGIQPLSQNKRRLFFISLVVIFCCTMPLLVFYAVGYRYNPANGTTTIKTVGGMYISSMVDQTQMYVDQERVQNMRMFRSAAYIQDLDAGMHEVHVQSSGLYTWTKRLPVYPHLVTEAESFNVPKVPHIRLITHWTDEAHNGILFDHATSTHFTFASNTAPLIFSTSTATSSFSENPEYTYISSSFASSSVLQKQLLQQQIDVQKFTFANDKQGWSSSSATSTVEQNDIRLHMQGKELYATWDGDQNDPPYYFCVTYQGIASTSAEYGDHVVELLQDQLSSTTDFADPALFGQRLCRSSIRIDRLGQHIKWFGFFPGSNDILLVLLDDGLYAEEIDDRAWQNTQLMYPGSNLQVILEGGRIYVKDESHYLELYTTIAT